MEEIQDIKNFKVSIVLTENRSQYGKAFTEYILDVTTSTGYEYTIARRFSEFYQLYELLVHNFQIQFPFPPKKLNKLNGNIIEIRKKGLQDFLKYLIINPSTSLRRSEDVLRFLDQNTANFNNKLIKEKITFEQVNQKKKSIKLELSIIEGKEIKLHKRSMWDIISFCTFAIGCEPNYIENPKSTKKTSVVAGPYPHYYYKNKITIKATDKKIIHFKVYNQETVLSQSPSSSSPLSASTSSLSDSNSANNSTHNSSNNVNNSSSNSVSSINSNISIDDSRVELIGSCSVDIEKLSITNQSPILQVLHLEPEGTGEIVISLLLL